ncbi:hypothetical protein LSH36_3485g00000, partial [Paralvinella palmiformis]
QYHQLPRSSQWLAPEVINLNHVIQSDIWSLALLMWEIFNAGDKYFRSAMNTEARQKVLNRQKTIKPKTCSDDMYVDEAYLYIYT